MRLYGITGGIGAGKSAVTSVLREFGHTVIDLDQVARDVVDPGSDGIAAISDTFGAAYLNLDGTLNRKMLADLVFNNKDELAKLDALMGPLLWAEVQRQLVNLAHLDDAVAFVDGALIIEKGMHEKLDGTILVTAPVDVRVRRAMARDGATEEHVRARVAAQMPDEEKMALVDYEIENTGTLDKLRRLTAQMLEAVPR